MALVSYSDSESSDLEETPAAAPATKPAPDTAPALDTVPDKASTTKATTAPRPVTAVPGGNAKLVDRRNPRKIVVNLGDKGTDNANPDANHDNSNDSSDIVGPQPRRGGGGGGGLFAGFNAMLPPPKRPAVTKGSSSSSATPAKPFNLKTGASVGFDRNADAQMRRELDEAGGGGGGLGGGVNGANGDKKAIGTAEVGEHKKEPVTLKGNSMMFKPLSVSRNNNNNVKKKKRPALAAAVTSAAPSPAPSPATGSSTAATATATAATTTATTARPATTAIAPTEPAPPPPKKPKVSLFGFSRGEEDLAQFEDSPEASESLLPLAHTETTDPDLDIAPNPPDTFDPSLPPITPQQQEQQTDTGPTGIQSLDTVASDLNLSKPQLRQLFGRRAKDMDMGAGTGGPGTPTPQVLTFDTNRQYRQNAEWLASATEEELAAQQHNPVRSIAPGRHSLQQLVNAVSVQKDALEETFAAGRRNKKEAGARYGW